MASVLVLLLLFFVHWTSRSHAFSLTNYLCNNGSSYALNSTYRSNVVALLGSLSANASSSVVGFAAGTLGRGPDQTWGLALCRGNVNGSACASCLALAPDVAFGRCRGVKDTSIYYDRCLLRYSGTDFLASPGDAAAPVLYGPNLQVNVTADPGRFAGLTADLVAALSAWAARNSTARYAAGVVTSAQGFTTTGHYLVHDIYGLVQCMPNQAPDACLACLGRLRDEMPAVFNGSTGGQFNAVWCNLRFEVFLFYDSSPVVKLVAPPLTPAPAVHDDAKRTRGYAATVVAIVLGVLVIVLLSTFTIHLWRKAQVKRYAEEADDSGSLLFELATLRRATGDFAEENKLGHGGFGAVYKGFLPDGRRIAVKRLDKASGQGLKELRNELLLVAKLRHNNLAKLLGVCLKGQEKLLVYEYMQNRSLDTYLFAPEKRPLLDWEARYRILYGTARGLLYLHEDSQVRIVHRDLKASNILLCVQENPADRPTMLDVLVMLHGQSSGFAAPSKPAFAFAYGETASSDEPGNVSRAAAATFSLNRMSSSEFQPR